MGKISKDKRLFELQRLLAELQQQYKLSREDVLKAAERSVLIPVSLFSSGLSSLEIIVKYLLENQKLSISEVSRLVLRPRQAVYQAYKSSKLKSPSRFKPRPSKFDFPVFVIANSRYSVLESIVRFLKIHHNLSFAAIAALLCRDQRTIWTVHNRL
ncbi:MAG: hypothetical protein ABIF10_05410, partial [Candidatus Woesearchaeota archaeon]